MTNIDKIKEEEVLEELGQLIDDRDDVEYPDPDFEDNPLEMDESDFFDDEDYGDDSEGLEEYIKETGIYDQIDGLEKGYDY
jgi:hypothetical protein